MGRSQRSRRDSSHYREDSLGDRHYPGTGQPVEGANINPALQPGGWGGYVYDWGNTWPSGSGSVANPVVTYSGITLTTAGLPENAGTITVTGTAAADAQGTITFDSDSAGGPVVEQATFAYAPTDDTNAIAAIIATAINETASHLGAEATNVVDFNLQGAGTINRIFIAMGPLSRIMWGPFTTGGTEYFLQGDTKLDPRFWNVWFDLDGDPEPDLAIPMLVFLDNDDIASKVRTAIRKKAVTLGYSE